ncbi:unnamed protein product [Penicillium camemberti]|uniref:Str. FM013 n=1 Tax=Penicillium camemberti (strain FM 013) TaxID=1429867 RepID=A0A0G4PGI1_PENC3|nr:unnamed protein product [Penicillium camemberti]
MTLVPEVEVQDPRSYFGLPGGHLAPGSGFFAPRNRIEATGSKMAPRAKPSFPGLIELGPGNLKSVYRSCVSPGKYSLAPGATSLS